jgi:hypothetical protein
LCQVVRATRSNRKRAKSEISRIERSLTDLVRLDKELSSDCRSVLEGSWQPLTGSQYANASQPLSVAVFAAAQALALLRKSGRSFDRLDLASRFLAHGVARAFVDAGLPLSKGRDGLLARVLTVVWHAVEPERVPSEVFPLIKVAVDTTFVMDPGSFAAPRGRPRKKKR